MPAEPHPPEPLSCEVVPGRDRICLRPEGSLDMATVAVLEERLGELRAAGHANLLLDLRGLQFMDSSGLWLVLRWHATARANGFTLGVVRGRSAIQRVFEVTGTHEHVRFVDPD